MHKNDKVVELQTILIHQSDGLKYVWKLCDTRSIIIRRKLNIMGYTFYQYNDTFDNNFKNKHSFVQLPKGDYVILDGTNLNLVTQLIAIERKMIYISKKIGEKSVLIEKIHKNILFGNLNNLPICNESMPVP